MRRSLMAMAAAAALTSAAMLAPKPAPAAEAALAPTASPSLLRTVQSHGAGLYRGDGGWERRRQWRERQDEARIAEAARREAWRIGQEREQRRAWRRAQREQRYGHGPVYGYGYQRGW